MLRTDPFAELESLLRQCRRGDARAWSAMVDRFQSHVFSVARRADLSEDDASDVFQATFLALYRSLDRIESGRALPKWLATTAGREALRIKRSKRGGIVELDGVEESLDSVLAAEDSDIHAMAAAAADSFHIRGALRRMELPCRELLEALYEEKQPSYQEISTRFGIPVGSIGPRRARCLERLRRMLDESGFFQTK